ncbi:MAG: FliA/WhiG family RNA polymerase sigma factor [Lachnospiraceae bacterium]|nr:FliA/WhiG family RNA polymerase sigma factor [Lachnospiraceae bacterium]
MDKEKSRKKLWEQYSVKKTSAVREQLILEYVPLVKIVAGRLSMYLGYAVEFDDLVGYGIFGLIDAIDKFDYGKGIKFETYASLRIRGSILDSIRKMDWIPRSVRQKQKKIEQAFIDLETKLKHAPSDEELAEELGISVDEYYDWEGQTKISGVSSLEDYLEQGTEVKAQGTRRSVAEQPELSFEQDEVKRVLADALTTLTEKECLVVQLYYYEELTLKEISKVMDVSESRVSQLHTKAITKMKDKLGPHMELLMG